MKKTTYKEKRFSDFREIIRYAAEKFGSGTAFLKKEGGKSVRITYRELKKRFYALCNAFMKRGFTGKRIGIIGRNCPEWVLSYLCAATVGVAVPLDKELSPEDIRNFANDAECVAVCTESNRMEQLAPVLSPSVACISFDEINTLSEEHIRQDAEGEIDRLSIPRDQMQILIFTSGTTGSSKGVCLSQYNICSDIYSTVQVVKIRRNDRTLSVLPLHHTYECTLDCLLLLSRGACITFCEGLTHLKRNISEYRPTVLVVVPLLLKTLHKQIKRGIVKSCPTRYREIFENESLASALRKTPFPIRFAIRKKVLQSLGGALRLFIVGAADVDVSLVEDFSALGIRTLQGYGLTECSPLLAGNSDFFLNPQSTGRAVPGVELRIDRPNEDGIGEILAKGDNIMLGYYRDPVATAGAFLNGWFRTGDLGSFGPDGALYIRGRCKNVIVTENGKNIYPEELETRLSEYPEIGEVFVLAQTVGGNVCVKAKILPNLEYLREKLGHIPLMEEVQKAIQKVVKDLNEKIPGYKNIRVFEVLTKALEKTTTQKIKRFGTNAV